MEKIRTIEVLKEFKDVVKLTIEDSFILIKKKEKGFIRIHHNFNACETIGIMEEFKFDILIKIKNESIQKISEGE